MSLLLAKQSSKDRFISSLCHASLYDENQFVFRCM